jgi:hypothetical protein
LYVFLACQRFETIGDLPKEMDNIPRLQLHGHLAQLQFAEVKGLVGQLKHPLFDAFQTLHLSQQLFLAQCFRMVGELLDYSQ